MRKFSFQTTQPFFPSLMRTDIWNKKKKRKLERLIFTADLFLFVELRVEKKSSNYIKKKYFGIVKKKKEKKKQKQKTTGLKRKPVD